MISHISLLNKTVLLEILFQFQGKQEFGTFNKVFFVSIIIFLFLPKVVSLCLISHFQLFFLSGNLPYYDLAYL